jgi:hypothetical protein
MRSRFLLAASCFVWAPAWCQVPPAGAAAQRVAVPVEPGSAAQARRAGRSASIPAASLPTTPPEEVERQRRLSEQRDREAEEKRRTAMRDSPEGKHFCAMMQARLRDAEGGVVRGRQEDRTLSPQEKAVVVSALRREYEKVCR